MSQKKYGSLKELVASLREQCVGRNPDGSKKFPIDWALTNGSVLELCDQIEELAEKEKPSAVADVSVKEDACLPNQAMDVSPFDYDVIVGALRYYEHRATVAGRGFPARFIEEFFTSDYFSECKIELIARQFVLIDHGANGEKDWDRETYADKLPWCRLFAFLKAYLEGWKIVNGVECFHCGLTGRDYPKDEYINDPDTETYMSENGEVVKA